MPIGQIPKNVKTPGYDDYLALTSKNPARRQSVTHLPRPQRFLTVILHSHTLQARIRNPQLPTSELFLWSKSANSDSTELPAVLAINGETSIWGFDAMTHPRRIENLRESLETRNRNEVREAVQNVGRFLLCILNHIQRYYSIQRYTFTVPSRWSEVEIGRYRESIEIADCNKPTIRYNIEAGAFWMARYMRQHSKRHGVVFIGSEGLRIRLSRT